MANRHGTTFDMDNDDKQGPLGFASSREAARLLGVSLRTVQLWCEDGVLQAWKTAGGHRRVARSSIETMLTEQAEALRRAERDQTLQVLIVDDEPEMQRLYRAHLESWDMPLVITTAENGFEGLIRIGQRNPDFVIVDLVMPGMDGLAMIRHLKNLPGYTELDIVVATQLSPEEIEARGGLSAEISVLRKPISFDRLRSLIQESVRDMSTRPRDRKSA